MYHEPSLRMLRETFRKCRIQTLLLDPAAPLDPRIDMGLSKLLGVNTPRQSVLEWVSPVQQNTVYRLTDSFRRRYLFFLLPEEAGNQAVLLIGPYLPRELPEQKLLELAEQLNLPAQYSKELEEYYGNLPVLSEDSHLFALLDSYEEQLWGNKRPSEVLDLEWDAKEHTIQSEAEALEPERTAWNMQMIEERYNFENDLMTAVEHGQLHKAEILFSSLTTERFEQRTTDPIRNLKNYCVIMNTLLRKSAERGGVHPTYLDSMSSSYARKIEGASSMDQLETLMPEMFRSYCRLVRKHSMRTYSSTIQKTILMIDSDLSVPLSLSSLAKALNISAGYLSDLFRREVGQTLTEFINRKRVERAKQLLSTTQLQIQTVAQHCGFLDVQYFSKTFKKYALMTPREFRQSSR
ncbi:MAG: helix-turn-helix domain-containing protein [Clostridia bacterium]|nr:helix-turn-helix domain-containing protein [Clostridia bacterium]